MGILIYPSIYEGPGHPDKQTKTKLTRLRQSVSKVKFEKKLTIQIR